MTDYIKREDAKIAMRAFGVNRLLTMIDEVPSADVVEVVHCKDCEDSLLNTDLNLYCPYFDHFVDEDFYCKYGDARHD